MIRPLKRCAGLTLERLTASTLVLAALVLPAVIRAQTPPLDPTATRSSVSGQFVVISTKPASPPVRPPDTSTNAGLVRLEPALLAVSAERVKQPIWRQLGVDSMTSWRGRIILALHPAASPDENVAIISTRFSGIWNYRVELPDVLPRTRLTRALAGALLLELANRDNSGDHSAEIPAWLTEGLSQQLLADAPQMIVSQPGAAVNGLPVNRIIDNERGVDTLANIRPVLHDHPALTFDQLSWPDDAQLNGDDGGLYRASAQLFVSELLGLNDGAKNLRAMLQMLPRCYNWQTAFRAAFAADFPRPIDLEKWWALQSASFAARDAGPAWTSAASRGKLDEILSVPVEIRSAATNLPVRAAISLQAVIDNFDFDRQRVVLQARLRDLDQARWRMAPPFAGLTGDYYRTLADYLGGQYGAASASGSSIKRPPAAPSKTKAADTVKKLDALDAQRRTIETAILPDASTKQGLNAEGKNAVNLTGQDSNL